MPLSAGRPSEECAFALQQCYPNPPAASSDITIPFSLSRPGHFELRLYDALGRECATLANGLYTGGAHRISFSVRGLSRGVYYYRLNTAEGSATRTMLLQ
ncbi:MAG: T9SS type A sorting domain-containing protein [Ignavibacteria bacterium]|nr:T9SS type A sorting domain-containing protein [Ignavibacteria bacterium]